MNDGSNSQHFHLFGYQPQKKKKRFKYCLSLAHRVGSTTHTNSESQAPNNTTTTPNFRKLPQYHSLKWPLFFISIVLTLSLTSLLPFPPTILLASFLNPFRLLPSPLNLSISDPPLPHLRSLTLTPPSPSTPTPKPHRPFSLNLL